MLIHEHTNLFDIPAEKRSVSCVLVDEAQFLAPKHIDQLRAITSLWDVPVICYGLRTDFRTNLFPGSKRLLEVADSIEEVKVGVWEECTCTNDILHSVSCLSGSDCYIFVQTTCALCNRKAVFNLKHVNGKADISGPVIQLGAEEKYYPACFPCYRDSLKAAGQFVDNWQEQGEQVVDEKDKLSPSENAVDELDVSTDSDSSREALY